MSCIDISSASAAICAQTVSRPWPMDEEPTWTEILAVGFEHEARALLRA